MSFEGIRFHRDVADLALRAATEIDKRIRSEPECAEIAVNELARSFLKTVEPGYLSVSVVGFHEMHVLFRDVLHANFPVPLKTTDDMIEAIRHLSKDWEIRVAGGSKSEMTAIMQNCLDVHQYCVSRSGCGPFAMGFTA